MYAYLIHFARLATTPPLPPFSHLLPLPYLLQGIPSLVELKLRYYELMIQYHQHYHSYLEICRCYKAIFESEGVQADPAAWVPVGDSLGAGEPDRGSSRAVSCSTDAWYEGVNQAFVWLGRSCGTVGGRQTQLCGCRQMACYRLGGKGVGAVQEGAGVKRMSALQELVTDQKCAGVLVAEPVCLCTCCELQQMARQANVALASWTKCTPGPGLIAIANGDHKGCWHMGIWVAGKAQRICWWFERGAGWCAAAHRDGLRAAAHLPAPFRDHHQAFHCSRLPFSMPDCSVVG